MDNQIEELDEEHIKIIAEYKTKGKLHPDFLPFTTYDMVQCGYPRPTEGIMIARDWGGTDENYNLLPANGMWCKVEDVVKLLEKHNINLSNELKQ